jgi:hypothetical protein
MHKRFDDPVVPTFTRGKKSPARRASRGRRVDENAARSGEGEIDPLSSRCGSGGRHEPETPWNPRVRYVPERTASSCNVPP